MRKLPILLPVLLAVGPLGCGAPLEEDEAVIVEDAPYGDSLADGKADGYGVPASLGLDKNRVIYLTFDDGPSAYTSDILDILARHGAKATFFVNGSNVGNREHLLQREAAEGHIVGNHQWVHGSSAATMAQFRDWVPREREYLADLLGASNPLYFRYPFGASSSAKETFLKQQGYIHGGIGWDIDSLDWSFGADEHSDRQEVPAAYRDDFEGWIMRQAEKKGGGVVLLHDVQSITRKHLDSILTKFEAKGFRFGQLPRAAGADPVTPGKFIGDTCQNDSECTFAQGFCFKDAGLTNGYCTRPCTSTCPDSGDGNYPLTRCTNVPDGSGGELSLCTISCGSDGSCPSGTACGSYLAPSGVARNVCWAP